MTTSDLALEAARRAYRTPGAGRSDRVGRRAASKLSRPMRLRITGLTIATLLAASSLALAQYGADVYQACYGSAGGRAGAEGLGAPVRTNH
jgi:hypothetical protein